MQLTRQGTSGSGPGQDDDSPRAAAVELAAMLRRLFLDPRADHLGAIERRNLSLTQVRALFLLACAPEPVSGGDLATRLGLSPAAMSRSLDTLVRRRLATRRESAADRRVRLVAITERGSAVVDELVALRVAGLERFVSDLDAGRRHRLTRLLAEINASAAAAANGPGNAAGAPDR